MPKLTNIMNFNTFAFNNKWLELYRTDEQAGYVLPDGSTFVIKFNNDNEITEITDRAGDSLTCDDD